MRGRLIGLIISGVVVAPGGCAGVEQWPGISTGFLGAVALSGGVYAVSDGHLLEGLGLTALGVGLGVVAFVMIDSTVAEAPRLDRRAVALALAKGHGPPVTDLASDLGLSQVEVRHLGQLLRQARPSLTAALPAAGAASWRPFFSALRAVIAADPLLAPRLAELDLRIQVALR